MIHTKIQKEYIAARSAKEKMGYPRPENLGRDRDRRPRPRPRPRPATGDPATATAQRLPFHDSFRPAAPEARRRALRARAAARRARSAAGDGAARPGPITQLISAEKISSMSRVYFDMSVAESNTRKTHLSGSFFFWPVGLNGAGVRGLW